MRKSVGPSRGKYKRRLVVGEETPRRKRIGDVYFHAKTTTHEPDNCMTEHCGLMLIVLNVSRQ